MRKIKLLSFCRKHTRIFFSVTTITVAALATFLTASSYLCYIEFQAKSRHVSTVTMGMAAVWYKSLSTRADVVSYETQARPSRKTTRALAAFIKALNLTDDDLVKWGAKEFDSLNVKSSDVKFPHCRAISQQTNWDETACQTYQDSLALLKDRLELESRHLRNELKIAEYEKAQTLLREQEDVHAKQLGRSYWLRAQPTDSQDLKKEVAGLKDEVATLRNTQRPRYPAEFWILLAAAVCSWLVMLYNFTFSLVKERRERRKEQCEEAMVLPYLESDVPKFVTEQHLSTRPKS